MSCSSSSQKTRVPNFTTAEIAHLLNLIANKYALTLEDKKTDRVSTDQKTKAWQLIEDEFNASSTSGIYRNYSSLKKFYENRKKNLRKALADERKEIMLTGGGPPPKIKKDDSDDILLSILNNKTLVGINSPFDDDADTSFIEVINKRDDNIVIEFNENDEEKIQMDQIQASTSADDGDPSKYNNVAASNNWKTYTPSLLQTPTTAALMSDSENKISKKASSRRRPTTIVKPLTSSEIAKKYDILLDKRLQLIDVQLEHTKVENELIIKKRKMEIELVQIDLNSKKK